MKFYAISPALNEETTIESTVLAAAGLVESVIVVDNGSTDRTAEIAESAGALVVSCDEVGKAQAVNCGVKKVRELSSTSDEIGVVLLDADLSGLTATHVETLISPLRDDGIQMVCGQIINSRSLAPFRMFTVRFPFFVLTGQRAVSIEILESIDWDECRGYFLESFLNRSVALKRTKRVMLSGVTHTRREKKPNRDWAQSSHLPHVLVGPSIRTRVLFSYLWLYLCSIFRFKANYRWTDK